MIQRMKTEAEIREQLRHHRENLDGWREPNPNDRFDRGGYLLPTEPDIDERHAVRQRLNAAIRTPEWVLGEEKP